MVNSKRPGTTAKPLHRMFTAIPRRYDLINHIITLGQDKRWRGKAARECLKSKPAKVLDLCCGTGDLAITLASFAENNPEITGLDYSQPMLDIANKKADLLAKREMPSFIYGDACNLPFPDGYFNCAGISFAFRNLTYKNPLVQHHLSEVFRVLKSGGRFIIVETSQPKSKIIREIYHVYLRSFAFCTGYLLSGNRQAYRYLAESAARFYNSEEIKEMLFKTGFRQVSFQPFLFGTVGIHVATK
jgi:demethylmenaquinone methyltransferase/2-methoxy-6-polyprenyl-1,4-benzoquinol methylase